MKKTTYITDVILTTLMCVAIPCVCYAQPYGQGKYDTGVPYGSLTSISISTNGNISVPVTPTSEGSLATGLSTVTVTSTGVNPEGYSLYIKALSDTNMDNMGTVLSASANVTPAALANNTWGYNTDASTNFAGITLNDTLIHDTSTASADGDITNVTYGVKVDMQKKAGNYTANVVYTAVAKTH